MSTVDSSRTSAVTIDAANTFNFGSGGTGLQTKTVFHLASSSFSGSITVKSRPIGGSTFSAISYKLQSITDSSADAPLSTAAITDSCIIEVETKGSEVALDCTSYTSGSMVVTVDVAAPESSAALTDLLGVSNPPTEEGVNVGGLALPTVTEWYPGDDYDKGDPALIVSAFQKLFTEGQTGSTQFGDFNYALAGIAKVELDAHDPDWNIFTGVLGLAHVPSTSDKNVSQLYGMQAVAQHDGTGTMKFITALNAIVGTTQPVTQMYVAYIEAQIQAGAYEVYGIWNRLGAGLSGTSQPISHRIYGSHHELIGPFTSPKWYGFSALVLAGQTIDVGYVFHSDDLAGKGIPQAYYFWADSRGVYRVKEDATVDGVGQAIPTLYNPRFTKYVAGAADYERIVQQWRSNVAEVGAEAAGTGVVRTVQLVGKGILFPSYTTTNRDLIAAPETGLTIFNSSTNKLNFYNGVSWEAVTSG